MSISQADIALKVGVSRTAVSHVLNGRPHMVGPEVRERILNVVEAVGYHRNALVRALKSNRTHVVGIIVPQAGVSFFSDIIQAAETSAVMHHNFRHLPIKFRFKSCSASSARIRRASCHEVQREGMQAPYKAKENGAGCVQAGAEFLHKVQITRRRRYPPP